MSSSTPEHSFTPVAVNLALLAGSGLLTFVVLEIVARLMLPAALPWRYPQVRYRADPTLVFALAPEQRAFTADKPVQINARGLRGPLVPYTRAAGTLRILFLGDSIVFGYGVRDEEVVSARVAALLSAAGTPAEVVNTAVPSYNTEQELAYLKAEGIRYQPDWVVVGICWNDINDKSSVKVDGAGSLTDDLVANHGLFSHLAESPLGYRVRNGTKRSRLLYGALQGWRAFVASRSPDVQTAFRDDVLEGHVTPRIDSGWAHLEAAIREMNEIAHIRGFRLLLVTFPVPITLDATFPQSSYPARLHVLADREAIPLLDLYPAYRNAYHGHESLFIPYDGDHPNAAGHALAAQEITRLLTTSMASHGTPTSAADGSMPARDGSS